MPQMILVSVTADKENQLEKGDFSTHSESKRGPVRQWEEERMNQRDSGGRRDDFEDDGIVGGIGHERRNKK